MMEGRLSRDEHREKEKGRLSKKLGTEVSAARSLTHTLRLLMGNAPVFGHHGGSILEVDSRIYTDWRLREQYIHVPHEQIAGHAAEGFASSTGEVGVAIVTSGPALTNLYTPAYDAMMDSVPVVFITGNVPQHKKGHSAFQETNSEASFGPISKKVFYVTEPQKLQHIVVEAFHLAKSGRPGPVIIDIASNIFPERVKFDLDFSSLESKLEEKASPDLSELKKLSQKIESATRPVIYVGGGVKSAKAWDELLNFVFNTGAPVVYSLKGKGAFPDSNPLCIGAAGVHGSYAANKAVDNADLLIALGTRFSDRTTRDYKFAQNAHVVQVNIDPRGIGPDRKPDQDIKADVKAALKILNGLGQKRNRLTDWYSQINIWQSSESENCFPKWPKIAGGEVIEPYFVIQNVNLAARKARRVNTGADSDKIIYVTDVGQHQMWTMQYLLVDNPLGFLSSGGSGTMGYGLPAAFGAKLGNPESEVVLITGDASFKMTSQTLELYNQRGLDITILCVDNQDPENRSGGMVHQMLRRREKQSRLKIRGAPADLVKVASGYGISSRDVSPHEDIAALIRMAIEQKNEPVFLNFKVNPFADVYTYK